MALNTGRELTVALTNDDASVWLPVPYIDLDLEGTRYMSGSGSIVVPSSSDIVSTFMGATVAEEFANCSLRAWYRDLSAPLWSGPVTGARMRSTGDRGTVEIVLEQFYGHFLRRRQFLESAMAQIAFTSGTTAADNIALTMIRKQMGASPTTPATYPLGVSRTNFGPFTPAGASNHSPAQSSSMPGSREQSGTNLQDWFEEFAEQEDLAPLMSDPLTQAFTVDVAYPFENDDLSASIRFGQWYGNLAEFEVVSDYRSLANVWCIEGNTAGTHTFTSDSGSITVWGVFESRAQKPQETADSTDTSAAAGWLLGRYAAGSITYKATILETSGCLFNVDWFQRDRVRFEEAVYGYAFDQVVRDWSCRASDGGPPEFDFVMGDMRTDTSRHLARMVGTAGPRFGGGRWRNKRN